MSEDQAPYIVEVPAAKTSPATPLEQALELLLMAWRLLEIDRPNDERVDELHKFLLKHLPGDDTITPENLERAGWRAGDLRGLPAWVKPVWKSGTIGADPYSYCDIWVRQGGAIYLCLFDGYDEATSRLIVNATTVTQLTQLYIALGGLDQADKPLGLEDIR